MHTTRGHTQKVSRYSRERQRVFTLGGLWALIAFTLYALATEHPAQAAMFTIAPGDVVALITAINTANRNGEDDTIILAAGTYTLTTVDNETMGPNGLPSITSSMTIRGAGAAATMIERAISAPAFRLMHVATGLLMLEGLTLNGGRAVFDSEVDFAGQGGALLNDRGTVILTNSTIAGNSTIASNGAGGGGGLFNDGGTVTVTNCILTGNSAEGGGGLFNDGGTVTVTNSTIADNFGGSDLNSRGGGLFSRDGTVTIINSMLIRNSTQGGDGGGLANEGGIVHLINTTLADNITASLGGGFFNQDGTVTLTHSIITHNHAAGASTGVGGGIANEGGTLTLTDSTLIGNSAGQEGGGLNNFFGTVTFTNSTIADNRTDSGRGGGLFNGNNSNMTLINSTLAGNTAAGDGGGLYVFPGSTVTLTNSTVAGNHTESSGGGLFNLLVFGDSGTIELQNTILARNTAEVMGPDCLGLVTSQGYNLIGDTTSCDISLQPSDLTGDPQLGAFLDSGIPGQGRLPLLPNSPAIDAGNDAACPSTDQLEHPRIDGTGDGTVRCDIGAVEFYPVVNDLVALAPDVHTAFDPTPVPGGLAGTFTITATFTNTSDTLLRFPFFTVTALSSGNLLLNADAGSGGVGATRTPEVGDRTLSPGEAVMVDFVIGLQARTPFMFFVDLFGEPLP